MSTILPPDGFKDLLVRRRSLGEWQFLPTTGRTASQMRTRRAGVGVGFADP
jgi:hypothetical protein